MAKGESRFAAEVRLRPFEALVDEAIFGARLPTAAAKKIRLATATGLAAEAKPAPGTESWPRSRS